MHAVPELPWPANLFRQPYLAAQAATTAPLYGKTDASSLCACGCRQRHSLAVSKVVTEEDRHGPSHVVLQCQLANHRTRREGPECTGMTSGTFSLMTRHQPQFWPGSGHVWPLCSNACVPNRTKLATFRGGFTFLAV